MSEKSKYLLRRKLAYKECFKSKSGQRVLADLKRFCHATMPTFSGEETHRTAFLEGRREVFLRIQHHLHISDEQLHKLIEERQ